MYFRLRLNLLIYINQVLDERFIENFLRLKGSLCKTKTKIKKTNQSPIHTVHDSGLDPS